MNSGNVLRVEAMFNSDIHLIQLSICLLELCAFINSVNATVQASIIERYQCVSGSELLCIVL